MIMTLDEAIKHTEEVAEEKEKEAKEWHENQVRKCKLIPFPFSEMDYTRENECKQCAKEHRQLAKWLKELKQLREQEPCEDCISREQAKSAIRDRFKDLPSRVEINTILNDLPSVTPQPKIGYWNTYKLSQGGIDEEWLECSECMWSNALSIPRNYCPNCGCRMEGSE
jgi:hypothetical protein